MKKWIAVYTKPRHEKAVLSQFEEKGIESYLPLIRQKHRWSDRMKWVEIPIFKSYIFACVELKDNLSVLQTRGVHNIVKFQNKIAVIPEIQNKKHSLNLQPDILATSDYLETAKTRDDVILIDNRERLNFLEQHIPGAISLPYRTLATSDKILRSKEDMKRLLENRGITGNSEIITYCGSVGTLSGLAYYALKSAGLPNAKLYVRSFKEWKNLEKPTEKHPPKPPGRTLRNPGRDRQHPHRTNHLKRPQLPKTRLL